MSNPDSLTPPQGNSRSSSPNSTGSGPQQRIVSGSLKDRIAKFNNPSAPPPIPKQHIPSSSTRGGLIGNRIPGLDPKSVGHVPIATRRVSENRGLIGNRIPSMGSSGNINSISNQFTGQSQSSTPTVPKPAQATATTTARSASPAGSVDSSTASATLDSSTSPITSRSSSPPTSPGVGAGAGAGVPPSLLAATLPGLDDSSAGTATPSSTRAEIGDAVSELSLSMPSTPLAGTTPPLPAPEYDLVAPNLKLATANAAAEAGATSGASNSMVRGLSASSAARSSFAPSISSSLATQSRGSEEETQMMDDVSGISTPTGTPRAAHRELGEGSVVGEGSVIGDNDVEELGNKLVGLGVTPASPDQNPSEADVASDEWPIGHVPASEPSMPDVDEDPNQAADLDDLKAGKLATSGPKIGQDETSSNPMEHAAAGAMAQNVAEHHIAPEDKKTQGGAAGQLMEDVETADEVELPKSETAQYDEDDDLDVKEATPSASGAPYVSEKEELGAGHKAFVAGPESEVAQKEAQEDVRAEQHESTENDEQVEVDDVATPKSAAGKVAAEPEQEVEAEKPTPQESEAVTPTHQAQTHDGTEGAERQAVAEQASDIRVDENTPKSTETPTVPSTTVDEPAVVAEGAQIKKEEVTPRSDAPVQLQFEPAPIAQPATGEQDPLLAAEVDFDKTPAAEIEAPSFPTPPTADPNVEDSVDETPKNEQESGDTLSVDNMDQSAGSTPVDPTFLKSFPTVPDEEKPRVEVHVSSPATTPQKAGARRASTDAHAYGRGDPTTPLARLPGHSKSLSTSSAGAGVDSGSPEGSSSNLQGSSSLSNINDVDATPQATRRLSKRASTRRSPKSPLLDDEDPGDFEPGQDGWAVVTKWVIALVLILQLMTNLVLVLKGS